jgi:hypothetical protein
MNATQQAAVDIAALVKENERLREALRFYAPANEYRILLYPPEGCTELRGIIDLSRFNVGKVIVDRGVVARAALDGDE